MYNYFEVTIKYEKQAEEGIIVKVSEKYLVDALSFTEAEARITEEMKLFISGEFTVSAIKRANYSELFESSNGDKWFKSKVNFITLDEEKGIERRVPVYMLVQATDLKEARENLVEGMKGTLADYEVEAVAETKILDVFRYEEN